MSHVCGDELSVNNEAKCTSGADKSRQTDATAPAGNDADHYFGQTDLCPRAIAGDPPVARQRQLATAARARAVDRRDDRHVKTGDLVEEFMAVSRHRLRPVLRLQRFDPVKIRAGANLHWVESLQTQDRAETMARNGHEFLHEIASFYVPVIAAIHGACAGGGWELALACHGRIASDSARTQIGLPEVVVGVIPGWGGCIRLPRLVRARSALRLIVDAQLVPADMAHKLGLVDEVVAGPRLQERAKEVALEWSRTSIPRRPFRWENAYPVRTFFCSRARSRARTPAAMKAIDVIKKGLGFPLAAACQFEARAFGEIASTPEAREAIRAFFQHQKQRKVTGQTSAPT